MINQEKKLEDVLGDIDSYYIGTKWYRKNRALEVEDQRNNKSEHNHRR